MKHLTTLKEFLNNLNLKVVLTGAAGAGKSSVCDVLQDKGYNIVTEVARELISHYQKNSPEFLPQNNRDVFQTNLEEKHIRNWLSNNQGFFDRSLVDEIAYRQYYYKEVPTELIDKCKKYRYDMVFMFPPWREIYKTDSVRKESFELSSEIYEQLLDAYKLLDYEPVIVPKIGIEERTKFILNYIKNNEIL